MTKMGAHRDTVGLRAFIEKTAYNAPFGIPVTMRDDVTISDPRIVAVSLPSLLLMREGAWAPAQATRRRHCARRSWPLFA